MPEIELERDYLDYNQSVLQVLVQHRLLRAEEAEDLKAYLASS